MLGYKLRTEIKGVRRVGQCWHKEDGLHLGEEVEKRSWENTVSLFQDIMQRSRDPGEDGASNHPHGVGILVR